MRTPLLLVACALVATAAPSPARAATLLPFGAAAGDTLMPSADDATVFVPLPTGHPLRRLWNTTGFNVNNNGLVSANSGVSAYTPEAFPSATGRGPLYAPFWCDVDTRGAEPVGTGNEVWYRVENDPATADPLRVVVTWDRVGYYNLGVDRRNTFQVVFQRGAKIANRRGFEVQFRYPPNVAGNTIQGINWLLTSASPSYPQVGFDAGDGVTFVNQIATRTATVGTVAQAQSNVVPAEAGVWAYDVRPAALLQDWAPAPTVASKSALTVVEGGSVVFDASTLTLADIDSAASTFRYRLSTAPTRGSLTRTVGGTTTTLAVGTVFTQAEFTSGAIRYVHGGLDFGDSFALETTDEDDWTNGVGRAPVTITVNYTNVPDAPAVAGTLAATVAEGGVVTLTSTMLGMTDNDGPLGAAHLFKLTSLPARGSLRLNGVALSVGQTFTPADVAAAKITYAHNGSETLSDSFALVATEGALTSATATFSHTVTPMNDVPQLTGTRLATVAEGATVVVTSAMLDATDSESPATSLRFALVTLPVAGALRLSGTALAVGASFTVADVAAGRVAYAHDGREGTADAFTLTVTDGVATSPITTFSVVVTPVNDAPQVAGTRAGTVAEGGPLVLTAAMLSATDPDAVADSLRFALVTLPGAGALRLSGTALSVGASFTVADVAAGRVAYAHDGREGTADTFTLTVTDGVATSAAATFSVVVTPMNDAPQLAGTRAGTVAEGGSIVLTAAMLSATDPDSVADSLRFALTSLPGAGALRLSGTSLAVGTSFTVADVAAGRVAYVHDGREGTADAFTLTVTDGVATSPITTFSVVVTPVNDGPQLAGTRAGTVAEGGSLVLTAAMLSATDPDSAADSLRFALTSLPGAGALRLSGTALAVGTSFTVADVAAGRVAYVHAGAEGTADTFTLTVTDGVATSAAATFSVVVTPVNDAPQLAGTRAGTVAEGGSLVLGAAMLSATDPDSAAASLRFALTSLPGAGALRLSGTALAVDTSFTIADVAAGRVAYVHAGAEGTSDAFSIRVTDGELFSATAPFALTITATNDAPRVASADTSVTVDEGGTVALGAAQLDATDADHATESLRWTLVDAPPFALFRADGQPFAPGGTFAHTAALTLVHDGSERFAGVARFEVRDPTGASGGVVAVTLTVTPVNDAPVATCTLPAMTEGSAANALHDGLIVVTDPDDLPATLSLRLTQLPTAGALRIGLVPGAVGGLVPLEELISGAFLYDHSGDEGSTDAFSFVPRDADGAEGPEVVCALAVLPVNDAPSALDDTGTLDEDTTLELAVLSNDTDAEDDVLAATIDVEPEHGTVEVSADHRITYTPAANFEGTDAFTYRLSDPAGAFTLGVVRLTVVAVNDAPVTLDDTFDTDEDAPLEFDPRANDTDVDDTLLTIGELPALEHGTLERLDTGGLRFTPAADFHGDVTFTYAVTDAAGLSSTATVTLAVHALNDRPVANGARVELLEDTATVVVLAASDIEAAELTFTITTPPAHGTLAGTPPALTYVPQPHFNGTDGFAFTVTDGELVSEPAGVTLQVAPVDDAPVWTGETPADGAEFAAVEGAVLSVPVLAFDVDGDGLTYSVEGLPAAATVAEGTLTWTPTAQDAGTHPFTVTATDGRTPITRNYVANVRFIDEDADGLADAIEVALGLSPETDDTDGDGLSDLDELGDPTAPRDTDADGTSDALDLDSDGDGLTDADEAGDTDPATPPRDTDGDGTPDARDIDSDDDTLADGTDNCAGVANTEQRDGDGDGVGDACDETPLPEPEPELPDTGCGCSGPEGLVAWPLLLGLFVRRRRA